MRLKAYTFGGNVIYGTSGNGATAAFEVEPGDNIDVDYNDAFDASGNASTSTTTVSVSAGVDGTVSTSPATINSGDGVSVTVNDADQSGSVTATVKNLTTGETETVTLNETAPGSGVFTAVLPTVAGASPNDDGTMGTNAADQIGATYDDPVGASGASVTGIFSVTTTDGAFAGLPASLVVAETLNVTLNDLDFDGGVSGATRVNGAASLTLTVRNTITGETESLVVTENPAGSGTFEGSIATEYEDGTSITSSDGPLGVKPGDQVEVEYVDALGAGGGSPTITSSSITIVGGSTATVATSPTTVSIGGGITVTVTDADQSGSVTATVTNLTTGEVETLVLTETGPGTGVFTVVLPTVGGASGDNNGTLGANAGDQIRATYDDPVGAGGAPLPGISSMTSTDGAFSGLPATLKVEDNLGVTLTDVDFNGAVSGATRVSGAGILTLTVRNTTTGETESLTATENPAGSGVFDGTISTQYDDGTSPSSGDGTLGVKPTDQVEVEYADGLGASGAPTTITSSTVAIIGGSDGTIVAAPASIGPGDGVDVTVTDADLAGSGSLNVTVDNTTNGDSETLTLTETGTPGTFTATISTVFGTAASAGGGTIQAQAGDAITAEYTDQVTSGGAPVLRTSNTVSVSGGVLGTLSVSLAVQAGDGLRIELTDADLNTNAGGIDQAQVTVTNNTNGDTETITLDETGNNTGVFRVTPPVTTDAATTPTSENGTLSVVAQDDIETTYNDALNVSGGSETVTATTDGVLWGDNSLNLKVGALDASRILQHVVLIAPFASGSYEELVSDVNPPINPLLYPQVLADDATYVLQFTVGIISVFPIQTGIPNPHPYKRVGEERLLALGQPKVDGRQMLLPVWIDESDGVLSGQLKLDFDPAQYKIIGVANTENTSEYLVASNAGDGQLRIAFAGARSQSAGEAPLLHIQVEAIGQVDQKAPLTIVEASLNGGDLQTQTVEDFHSFVLPEAYSLLQNWPNPFNPETALRYSLPQAGKVQLTIYDMLGQQVRTLVDGHREAGAYTAHWDGRDATGRTVASGTYFYHIRADGFSKTRKMTLLR